MTPRILLTAAVVAWVATLASLVWMADAAGMGLDDAFGVLLYGDPVVVACAAVSVLMGVIGIASGASGDPDKAIYFGGDAFVWGLVGALCVEIGMNFMLINMNPPIPFSVDAISHAEALLVLLIGLTGAVVALALLQRRRAGA